ncbi:MAG TPA: transglutaminase-like domain-containing protein [Ktedonobacterales bacterium]|nr:transglutaminase-like domain-containing protein [Ktedonobacterales bacterium]
MEIETFGPLLRFAAFAGRTDEQLGLAEGALLVAEMAYPHLPQRRYLRRLDALTLLVREELGMAPGDRLPPASLERRPTAERVLQALALVIAEREGFSGNTEDYYDPRNSFLNEVLDRRTGIPISLALVLTEICRRVGIDARGVSFPGHFLVRVVADGDLMFIDPFDGRLLDERELGEMHARATGESAPLEPNVLEPASKRQILMRVLNNLRNIYERSGDRDRLLAVLARMQVLKPEDETHARIRQLAGGVAPRDPTVN